MSDGVAFIPRTFVVPFSLAFEESQQSNLFEGKGGPWLEVQWSVKFQEASCFSYKFVG